MRSVVEDLMNNHFALRALAARFFLLGFVLWASGAPLSITKAADERSLSGIYPHLAYWNEHGECGTGAVVPWAGNLWVISYAPHFPQGSTDKLYKITPELESTSFEGSVGGTPANRMIHRETNQLIIGPYVIDAQANVRVIPPSKMFGRLTGNARHLFEPERKVYYATMEEGIYEVDMQTLEVTELFRDYQNGASGGRRSAPESSSPLMSTPGYHGKGLYSGQGRLIYANNGEYSEEALRRPDIPSGCLAEWDGFSHYWKVIRRNQFTDVRGPGGLFGNSNPETDPIWAIGWDYRSLLLMLLDEGQWYTYRLPKASHAYDGAHGWNTEWPRINDIGEDDLVMNMHGMFWHFPRTFSRQNSSGLSPRSTYLKVVGDYCKWGDRLVFGCDDTAKNEFLNTRRAKGKTASPGQSHSNLWFTEPSILDELGPTLGRGSVWSNDEVKANTPSDPFLFDGFERRGLHIVHNTEEPITFTIEVDRLGNDQWTVLEKVKTKAKSATWRSFSPSEQGIWVRLSSDLNCTHVTAQFHYSNHDTRDTHQDPIFAGLAKENSKDVSGGILCVRGDGHRTLSFAATQVVDGATSRPKYYELDENLNLTAVSNEEELTRSLQQYAIPSDVVSIDEASVLYVDDNGSRWRLPRGSASYDTPGYLGLERVCREVVTERDLFNCYGTFFELPARNAGGFAKIRPLCSHNLRVKDFCSYRGLLVLSGMDFEAPTDNEHVIRSDDRRVALWAGAVDDLWKLGKPIGTGGPWFDSQVKANIPSDPFLMTGYDEKSVALSHDAEEPVTITLQVDIDGTGKWVDYKSYLVQQCETVTDEFPENFSAYWVRAVCNRDLRASVVFSYK